MGIQKKEKTKIAKTIDIIVVIILIIAVYLSFEFYQKNNFNDFVRSEQKRNISKFTRDDNVKTHDSKSYKIESKEYNDAMFFQTIQVEKNTPYKVTCKVKTKDVTSENNLLGAGAQISISDSTERSMAVQGTQDWQEIEMIFNSKNREEVNIGFRLGGYIDNVKGEAWFSDFKIEKGFNDENNKWNFACLFFQTVDVNVNKERVKLSLNSKDISDIKDTISRFETACRTLSNNKMTANCDMYSIKTPIMSLSYDEEFGYYVAPEDVEKQISKVIKEKDYDHIFIIVRLGDEEHKDTIQINDWIGLGAMDYYGVGFSNIRLPNEKHNYIYSYDTRVNTFPEEVLLHEFLHSLERNAQEYGYKIPALHDNKKYGYEEKRLIGLKNWYEDYMNHQVKTMLGTVGLPEEIYTLKPAKSSNFEFSYELNEFQEPDNIIEEIRQLFRNLFRNISFFINEK